MRRIGLIISLLFSLASFAQTYNVTTSVKTGYYQRNGVGNDQWQEQTVGSGQSVSGYSEPTIYYRRFTVPEIIDASGAFYWSRFDSKINACIQAHMKFGFGIFTMYAWPESDNFFNITPTMSGVDQRTGNTVSARSAVPLEWHTAMQAGGTKNWISESGDWVPNYNSTAFLTRLNALHAGVANHLDTGGYTPTWSGGVRINYKDVIQYIDVRGYGTWGEWHSYGTAPGNNVANYPPGTFPTIATFKAIIDAHVNNYDPYQLCIINNAFDGGRLQNIGIPAEIGVYALTRRTSKGWMGGRNDHAGEEVNYDFYQMTGNPYSFGGYRMDTAQQYRHRLAPRHGEPPGGPVYYNGVVQGALPKQVRQYKYSSIGNGNYGQGNVPTGAGADSVRLAYHLMGYHLRITGGSIVVASNITTGISWQNFGNTPTYDTWLVQYSLRNGAGVTVWTGNSAFNPYLFCPEDGEQTKYDAFTMPAVAAGTYGMYVTVKDPTGYMVPLQLQINGRDANGAYFLTNITIPSTTTNNRPIVSAGPNINVTLPDDDAAINATVSDADGTIASILWTQLSGPAAATFSATNVEDITVSDLVAGVYTFSMLVTDDDGATQTDEVVVTVNAAPNIAPVADAGDAAEITMPVDSILLVGSGSDDIAVTGFAWSLVSGPAGYTIATPTNDSTWVTGLVPGTYFFRLTVTDGTLTDTDDVMITVNAAAVPPGTRRGWIWSRKFQ